MPDKNVNKTPGSIADSAPGTKPYSAGRRYTIGFSVAGCVLIILLFAFINYTTGAGFPWFIFPSYAALWWPLATVFAGRRSMKALSLIGSLMTVVMLFALNYLTSWGYPWFLFPSFAVLWWPIFMYFGANHAKTISIVGCAALIIMLAAINLIVSPERMWFYYPAFAIIWWPLSTRFARSRAVKGYSIAGAALIIAFLTFVNYMESPLYPWAPLAYFPALMWPAATLLGKRLGKPGFALIGCLAGAIYYISMNILLFPGFPWAIFPVYALLWWPLAVIFAKRGRHFLFSACASTLSAIFFIAVNAVASPGAIWAVYPIFALCWWPLSTYFFVRRPRETEPCKYS
jgi:hypothetical protein